MEAMKSKEKIVKFVLEHNTLYLKTGYNYPVTKEDELFYFINFGGNLMKYPKFYFMVVYEKN